MRRCARRELAGPQGPAPELRERVEDESTVALDAVGEAIERRLAFGVRAEVRERLFLLKPPVQQLLRAHRPDQLQAFPVCFQTATGVEDSSAMRY